MPPRGRPKVTDLVALSTSRPEPEPDFDFEEPGALAEVLDPSTSASIGAGITGAVAGGILADSLLTVANVGLTGELLTDAGVIGAVLLGGGAVYAAQRPDEAGEAARFVGGSVANVTGAYAELAAVNAELALLEQQQKAQEALDDKIAEISALPGQVQAKTLAAADETAAAVKAAPGNLLDSVTNSVKSTLDGAQASVRAACGKWPLGSATARHAGSWLALWALRAGRAPSKLPIPRFLTPRSRASSTRPRPRSRANEAGRRRPCPMPCRDLPEPPPAHLYAQSR